MKAYPLLFTFKELVSGNGFLAGVSLGGRGLMVHEGDEDGWWFYGVEPGSAAEGGATPQEAHLRFREAFKAVLLDIASEVDAFDSFEAEVRRCLGTKDEAEEARWLAAVVTLREADEAESPFDDLPRRPAETKPAGLEVVQLSVDTLRPSENEMDQFALVAAA
jgi:hypothetical protein